MPFHEFRGLAARLAADTELSIWLVQFDPRWVEDEAAIKLRDELDDALLHRLIVGKKPLHVRRMLLYDLPDRGESRELDRRQSDWAARLQRDLAYLGDAFDYRIKQYVLPTAERARRKPDLAVTGPQPDRFKRLWDSEQTFPHEAGDKGAGAPYGDRDLLYYMDLDVGDTERRQLRAAREGRRSRPRARPMWWPRWRS